MEIFASWDESAGHFTLSDYEFYSSLEQAQQELMDREEAHNPVASLYWELQDGSLWALRLKGEDEREYDTYMRIAQVTVHTPPVPAGPQSVLPASVDCPHCEASGFCRIPECESCDRFCLDEDLNQVCSTCHGMCVIILPPGSSSGDAGGQGQGQGQP